jgi:nitrogen fixation/metabolism regulation signal transduction histidine kinase
MLKNFKIKALLYLGCILVVVIGSGYALFILDTQVYLLILIPVFIFLIYQLFSLVDKTNTEVASFLANIKYNDYATRFPVSKIAGDSYQDLHGAFNLVTAKFRDIRSEKEAQFQYLQAIVENVDTGLICFNDSGQTVLINKVLQQLLHKSYFPNFNSIQTYNHAIFDALNEIQPGERKLVKLVIKDQIVQLAIRKTILQMKDDALHLYAVQNIHSELEEQEVASWQKLIRILTHEIMNSIAPVVSLAATTNEIMDSEEDLSDESTMDIKKAIEAIHRRSQGLMHFTQTYRQLTKIPPPKFKASDPVEVIERVLTLLKNDLDKKQILIERNYKEKRFEAQLDPELMEQVFINLIKNAADALGDTPDPKISLHIFKSIEGELEIQIADNGPGISPELLDEIFVPFFTTKKDGSGIGLSLSRQIIQMHKGNLFAYSKEGKGTVFTMKL